MPSVPSHQTEKKKEKENLKEPTESDCLSGLNCPQLMRIEERQSELSERKWIGKED